MDMSYPQRRVLRDRAFPSIIEQMKNPGTLPGYNLCPGTKMNSTMTQTPTSIVDKRTMVARLFINLRM